MLVSWGQCRLQNTTGQLLACTDANLADASSANPSLTLAPPLYSAWLLNFNDSTLKPIFEPVEGVMISDLVSLQPRTLACVTTDTCPVDAVVPTSIDPAFGILDIRSVYDRDGAAAGLGNNASLNAIATANAANRPARFLRIEKVVPFGDPNLGDGFPKFDQGIALGNSVGYMRQILGYAPIEPDGSVRVMVPANVAFQITVLDANARALTNFPRHRSWLSVQPGEVLSCNGCHAPQGSQVVGPVNGRGRPWKSAGARTGAPICSWPSMRVMPPRSPTPAMAASPRFRYAPAPPWRRSWLAPPAVPTLPAPPMPRRRSAPDVIFNDAWGDGYRSQRARSLYTYSALTSNLPIAPSCQATWSGFCLSIINYPTIIDPLWSLARSTTALPQGGATCTNCHTATRTAGAGVRTAAAGRQPAARCRCQRQRHRTAAVLIHSW